MLRIIAGKHKGRRIESKEKADIRPTGSKARGAIFNILMHASFISPESHPLIGGRVVDIFCGTGALGFEALSRGAAHVTFIDQSAESLALARKTGAMLKEESSTQFIRSDSTVLPRAITPCTLAFLDPPYYSNLAVKALRNLALQQWLAPGALVVVELAAKDTLVIPDGYISLSERIYGNAQVLFLQYKV